MKVSANRHIGLLIALLAVFICLYPTLYNGLLFWDDFAYVTNNDLVKNLSFTKVKEIFTTPEVVANYHPISILSLAIDNKIAGDNPIIYHSHNLLLHLVNTCLVYVLFLRISKTTFIATIVTLLFAIHPMHVESVAWVSARKDLLYSFYYLLALIVYQTRLNSNSQHLGYLIICITLFLMSLLSKGMAITLPFIFLGLDYLNGRSNYKKMLLEKIPFFLQTFVFLYVGIRSQNIGGALSDNGEIPIFTRPFFASYGLVIYVLKSLVPFKLSAFYPYPAMDSIPWYIYASAIPVLVAFFYILKQLNRRPIVFFSFFLFTVGIFPVIQLVPFGLAIFADRYTYLPYLGLFFAMAYYLNSLIQAFSKNKSIRNVLLLLSGGYIITLGVLSFNRTKVWKNDATLWLNVLDQYPDSYLALGNLGDYWFSLGDNKKALVYYNECLKVEDRYFKAYNNRGLIHQVKGDTALALSDFNKAIKLKQYQKSYTNKGVLLFQQGEYTRAIDALKKGLEQDSTYALAWFNLGNTYYKIAKTDLAMKCFDQAEKLGYNHIYMYLLRANLFNRNGESEVALIELKKCLDLYPNRIEGLTETTKQYIRMGRLQDALQLTDKTIRLYPGTKGKEAYFLRSLIFKELNDFRRSDTNLNKARELGYPIG